MTYSEKLQNPLWQKKRLEVLSRDNFTCRMCSDTTTTLHVHHKSYTKGSDPWEYPLTNFITYCKDCHQIVEYFQSLNYRVVCRISSDGAIIGHHHAIISHENNTDDIKFVVLHKASRSDQFSVIISLPYETVSHLFKLMEWTKKWKNG
jgi:hypothetical protein